MFPAPKQQLGPTTYCSNRGQEWGLDNISMYNAVRRMMASRLMESRFTIRWTNRYGHDREEASVDGGYIGGRLLDHNSLCESG